jgi:chaperonin GroES
MCGCIPAYEHLAAGCSPRKIGTHYHRVLTESPPRVLKALSINNLNQLESSMSTLRPLHDRVIVKRLEEERVSAGGIVIPDSATEKPTRGKVVAAGTGLIMADGKIRPMSLKAGDTVLFGKYAGQEIKIDGEDLVFLKEDDIVAVIEG